MGHGQVFELEQSGTFVQELALAEPWGGAPKANQTVGAVAQSTTLYPQT